MTSSPVEHTVRRMGVALSLGALLLFTSTVSPVPFPGPSAHLLVQYGGLDPAPPALYPIWSLPADIVAHLPGWSLSFRLGMLSAVFGAACVYLLYRIAAGITFQIVNRGEARYLPVVCGAAAAIYLMVAEPFWSAANRANPILFHVFLLLLSVRRLQEYERTGKRIHLWSAWFVWGMGFLEWIGMALAFPLLAFVAVRRIRAKGDLDPGGPRRYAVAFCAGFLVFAAALLFRLHGVPPAGAGPAGILAGFLQLVSQHLAAVEQQSTVLGWTAFVACFLVPCLLALNSIRQVPEAESFRSDAALHGALILVALALLICGAVPSIEAGMAHTMLSVPAYLFMATAFGCAVGYGYVYAERLQLSLHTRKTNLHAGLGALLLCVFVLGAAANNPRADLRSARLASQWAYAAIAAVPDQSILVSEGAMHDQLALAAHERHRRLATIDLSRAPDRAYRLAVARQFEAQIPKDVAAADLYALVRALDAEAAGNRPLAVCSARLKDRPARRDYAPFIGLLVSPPPASAHDPAAFGLAQLEFLNAWTPHIDEQLESDTAFLFFWHQVRHQTVCTANALGIWLEDGGFEREAMYVYRSVRRFDPENMSAVVNEIASTTGPTGAEADKEAWARMLNDLSQSMRDAQFRDRYNRDGPTRFPEHWFLLHATFPADRSEMLKLRIFRDACAQYLRGSLTPATTVALTTAYPVDPLAWSLHALAAIARGDEDEIDRSIGTLPMLNANVVPLRLAAGRAALANGDLSSAWSHILQAHEANADDLEVLVALVALDVALHGPSYSPAYTTRLARQDPNNVWVRYAYALRELAAGQVDAGIRALEFCIREGAFPPAIVSLIGAWQTLGRNDTALAVARHGLLVPCSAPEYWEVLAEVMRGGGQTMAAEYAYRQSEQLQRVPAWGRPEDLIVASLTRVETDREVLSAPPPEPRPAEPSAAIPATDVFPGVPDTVLRYGREQAMEARTPPESGKTAAPIADWPLDRDAAAEILRAAPSPGRTAPDAQPAPRDGAPPVPLTWRTA